MSSQSADAFRDTKNSKRGLAALLVGWLACATACGVLPSEVDVDLDYPLVVAGGLFSAQPDPFSGAGAQVKQTLSNEGVPTDKVEAVRVSSLELVHLSPLCESLVGCDLAFIELLEVFVESPGVDRVRVGRLTSPGATRLAAMELDDVDLAPYIEAEAMTLVASITLERAPIQDVSLEIRATLRVEVDVL